MRKRVFGIVTMAFLCVVLHGGGKSTITIAGTADLQGTMEPSAQKIDLGGDGQKRTVEMGGVSRISTIFKNIKQENPASVFVSAGDDLMGRYFHAFRGKAIFSLMSAAGYDLMVFGNHEFDKGSAVLAKALESATFTTICSDLSLPKIFEGRYRRWLIREMGGVKVGFFSLMTEGFPLMSSAEDVTPIGDNLSVAADMVKLLREKGADVVVLLSHVGHKQDRMIAKRTKGIDLIFGGHSHHYPRKMNLINKTAIVNGGEQGVYVVRVDIPLDEHNHPIHKDIRMRYIPVSPDVEEDSTVKKVVERYSAELPASIVLGRTDAPWDLRTRTTRKSESAVADMINDLLREKFKVDIVMNNAGAIRGKKIYPVGDITDTMLKEIDEFGNNAFIFRIKGRYIPEILENSAANYGKGGLMQVSGLRYRIRLQGKIQKCSGEKVLEKGSRVEGIKVLHDGKWEDLDPEKEYSVLSNSFLVKNAGDGYFWFRKYGIDMKDTYTNFYSIMAEYLSGHGTLTPAGTDGRLEIVH